MTCDSPLIPYGDVGMKYDVTHGVLLMFGLQLDGGTSPVSIFENEWYFSCSLHNNEMLWI